MMIDDPVWVIQKPIDPLAPYTISQWTVCDVTKRRFSIENEKHVTITDIARKQIDPAMWRHTLYEQPIWIYVYEHIARQRIAELQKTHAEQLKIATHKAYDAYHDYYQQAQEALEEREHTIQKERKVIPLGGQWPKRERKGP